MRILIPSAVIGGAVGTTIAATLGRDYAAIGVSTTGALAYAVVVYSLAPTIFDNERKSLLAPGLFGIALFSVIIFTYGAIAIALGRPPWFWAGWPFYIYTAAFGGLIGSVLTHLLSLGRVQGRQEEYVFYLGAVVLIGIVSAFALWAYHRAP